MEVSAKMKGAQVAAQKARLVANQIRGKSVEEALLLLEYSPKKGAMLIKKVLNSAIANAEHNEGADVDELKVSTICVDEGTTMKRIMPRAKGRADRILKRSCHITITVADSYEYLMGQKEHPTGIRRGIVKKHTSTWYAEGKRYAENLLVELEVGEYVKKRLAAASVSRVEIERPAQTAKVTVFTARPGIVIGKKGEDVETLRSELGRRMGVPVQVNIEEIRKPDLDAKLVADSVAAQLERRVMFRRAMKRAVQNAMR